MSVICPHCHNTLTDDPFRCPICGWLLKQHLKVGTKLQQGKYTIGKVLGRGGFGITYLGANTFLGRTVAIKELFVDGLTTRGSQDRVVPANPEVFEQEKARFSREAQLLTQFDHPNIVKVLDGFEENNTGYLVMEHLTGQTLAERIAEKGKLHLDQVQSICLQVTEALEVVHAAGMLHRDIKPENIFLTDTGRTVLIDFGTARHFEANKTSNHTRMVTPGYAPLEQYATQAKAGAYTDFYSLGATLYHALLGKAPPASIDRVTGAALEPLPLPAGHVLQKVIQNSLSLQVQERPQTAQSLKQLLLPLVPSGRSFTPTPSPPPPPHAPSAEELYARGIRAQQGEGVPRDEKTAAHWYRMAADQGHASAQNDLGFLYMKGRGVVQSHAEAAKLFRQAAEQGHAIAQYNLAVLFEHGTGVTQSLVQAFDWYRKAARQEHLKAQSKLARMYEKGLGIPADLKEAVFWYEKAAEQGDISSQHHLGLLSEQEENSNAARTLYWYQKAAQQGHREAQFKVAQSFSEGHGTPINLQQAAYWHRKAADQGHLEAQFLLGLLLEQGLGISKDLKQAYLMFQQAAQGGVLEAQFKVGLFLEEGWGTKPDAAQAALWYRRAADQGHGVAQNNLGVLFEAGRGVMQSMQQAIHWYRLAAQGGNAAAQYNLGILYEEGKGVHQDLGQALHWFQKSAEQGEAEAQFSTATFYEKGLGVVRDETQAFHWYKQAADQNHPEALLQLGKMHEQGRGTPKNRALAIECYQLAQDQGIDEAAERLKKLLKPRWKIF
ncbi:serine/threonine-protein kinase [Deinococcus roseus]|uniref:Protein kinase domain-containing protein n=1 Tax=Deinococcus roseus TaxID=392414 RepID=A0ABQ2DBX2_9DEIO|nr:serine/threonine-protein kinase [Deinococcus roseus]GGJ52214.1 hypothetical protein GCM10008938_42790 [Deinococcus roseus]